MKHLYLSILLALLLPVHLQAQSCPAPYATADYSIGTDGFTVSFAAESCDPDVNYRWDFGDGASTTYAENNREPVHVYTSDGTYIAKLYAQNACGDLIYCFEYSERCPTGKAT